MIFRKLARIFLNALKKISVGNFFALFKKGFYVRSRQICISRKVARNVAMLQALVCISWRENGISILCINYAPE